MYKQGTIAVSLATLFLLGCGGGGSSSVTLTQSVEAIAQKSVVLNEELNGYKSNNSVARVYKTQQSQKLSDILFMYLLKDNNYFPSIAYKTYISLGMGNLSEIDFNKKFVQDFATYSEKHAENLVYAMLQKLKKQTPLIAKTS